MTCGHGHDAKPGHGLGWPELGHTAPDGDELAVDADSAAQEVDSVDGEAEALSLAQPHASGEDDQCPVALGHGCRRAPRRRRY